MKLTLALVMICLSFKSLACTCMQIGEPEDPFKTYDTIVLASLVSENPEEKFSNRYGWKVDEVLKGELTSRLNEVTWEGTSCDPFLEHGQQWLLFLEKDGPVELAGCVQHRMVEHLEEGWRDNLGKKKGWLETLKLKFFKDKDE